MNSGMLSVCTFRQNDFKKTKRKGNIISDKVWKVFKQIWKKSNNNRMNVKAETHEYRKYSFIVLYTERIGTVTSRHL